MAGRRGFGEVERRATSSGVSYGVTGRIYVARKVDKEADRAVADSVRGACPECGRHISTRRRLPPLRSILQAAEEEELIDRAPPKIRGAGTAR